MHQKHTGSTVASKGLAFIVLISFLSELEMEGCREGSRDGRREGGGAWSFSTETVETLPHSSLGDKHQCST